MSTSAAGKSGGFYHYRSSAQSLVAQRRPWRELLAYRASYSAPYSFSEFTSRLQRNSSYFRVNYAMVVLFILFLSLLYHPFSLIVFVLVFVFWFLLYFFRDEPIVVCHRVVDDRVVLVSLGIVTIVSLGLTGVWLNVLAAISIGATVVVFHGTFRVTEDLFLDEDEFADGGLRSVVSSYSRI